MLHKKLYFHNDLDTVLIDDLISEFKSLGGIKVNIFNIYKDSLGSESYTDDSDLLDTFPLQAIKLYAYYFKQRHRLQVPANPNKYYLMNADSLKKEEIHCNYMIISKPLFTRDCKFALMEVDLYDGCGDFAASSGRTIVFSYKNGKWSVHNKFVRWIT